MKSYPKNPKSQIPISNWELKPWNPSPKPLNLVNPFLIWKSNNVCRRKRSLVQNRTDGRSSPPGVIWNRPDVTQADWVLPDLVGEERVEFDLISSFFFSFFSSSHSIFLVFTWVLWSAKKWNDVEILNHCNFTPFCMDAPSKQGRDENSNRWPSFHFIFTLFQGKQTGPYKLKQIQAF